MDPHDELGVGRGASAEEIRRAFAAAVRRVHPDAGGLAGEAGEQIRRLVAARDQLLTRLTTPAAEPAGPPPAREKLTRLQVAARVLGRLLYVSKNEAP